MQLRTETECERMARRHKLWAQATRQRMTLILGGKCTACRSTERLEFDCIVPMGHMHHAGSAPDRIVFYRRQMQAGNVQLLCTHCNALKSDIDFDRWITALSMLRQREQEMRLSPIPGRGTAITPHERVELLRDVLNILRSR